MREEAALREREVYGKTTRERMREKKVYIYIERETETETERKRKTKRELIYFAVHLKLTQLSRSTIP